MESCDSVMQYSIYSSVYYLRYSVYCISDGPTAGSVGTVGSVGTDGTVADVSHSHHSIAEMTGVKQQRVSCLLLFEHKCIIAPMDEH